MYTYLTYIIHLFHVYSSVVLKVNLSGYIKIILNLVLEYFPHSSKILHAYLLLNLFSIPCPALVQSLCRIWLTLPRQLLATLSMSLDFHFLDISYRCSISYTKYLGV